jgi:hypothetical protein
MRTKTQRINMLHNSRKARQWQPKIGSQYVDYSGMIPKFSYRDREAHVKGFNSLPHLTLMNFHNKIARLYEKQRYGDPDLSPKVNLERIEAEYPGFVWSSTYYHAMLDLSYNRNTDSLRYETRGYKILIATKFVGKGDCIPVAMVDYNNQVFKLIPRQEHEVVLRMEKVPDFRHFFTGVNWLQYEDYYSLKHMLNGD